MSDQIEQVDRDGSVYLNQRECSGSAVELFVSGQHRGAAFLGISIKNRMSNRFALTKAIGWLHARTGQWTVVIGDYPHRHNLSALWGLPTRAAREEAAAEGHRVLRRANRIAESHGVNATTAARSAGEIIQSDPCQGILRDIREYYLDMPYFAEDVRTVVLSYAEKARPDFQGPHAPEILDILKEYVLEEISLFLSLYMSGYHIEVYPGPDLSLMKKISTGDYADFPYGCPFRTHISLLIAPPAPYPDNK